MTNEMTAEEAVKIINAIIDILKVVDAQPHIKEENKFKPSTYEALEMAIQALEAQQNIVINDHPCEHCAYNDGEAHAECILCAKIREAQPTEMRDATEEERKSVKDYIESISKPTGVQPNTNEFFNFDAPMVKNSEAVSREEAIQELELKKKAHLIQGNTRMVDLCDLCIKAIKTKPCEDAISRSDLLQKIQEAPTHLNETWDELYDSVIDDINSMPSVYPERPKGKWIEIEIDAGEFIYKCTKCGMRVINPYKYCPICGAEMGGTDETN